MELDMARVYMGDVKPGKSWNLNISVSMQAWKVMEFTVIVGHGKSWKAVSGVISD